MPYDTLVERNLSVSRAKVYAALADFAGIDKLLPEGVASSCEGEGEGVGALRYISLTEAGGGPGVIAERVEIAHDGRIFGYSIINDDECPMPMKNYCCMVTLGDLPNGGCSVSWGANWQADGISDEEMCGALEGFYGAICDNIEAAG